MLTQEVKKFEVSIIETHAMKVTVLARDQCEAEAIASEGWHDGKYIPNLSHFLGANFTVTSVKQEDGDCY